MSLYKISIRGVLASSLYKISITALCTRSLDKISIRNLLVKISAQDLLDRQNGHTAATRAIQQAQMDERVARAISMSTARQRGRSDRPKVLREGCTSDLTRAILCRNLQEKCRTRDAPPAAPASCEPAQWKCTWHVTTAILPESYSENVVHAGYHLDETPGLNPYCKNPSVWPHCLGKNG